MKEVLIFLGIYILGVMASLAVIAWLNKDEGEDISSLSAVFSWLVPIAALCIYASYPFELFYKWCLKKFRKYKK